MSSRTFDYTFPSDEQRAQLEKIRKAAYAFEEAVLEVAPSRLRSVGLTQFELAVMAINKSITHVDERVSK